MVWLGQACLTNEYQPVPSSVAHPLRAAVSHNRNNSLHILSMGWIGRQVEGSLQGSHDFQLSHTLGERWLRGALYSPVNHVRVQLGLSRKVNSK